ncbi:MAG: phosphopantothenoylcysteine decarboxylase/phosphopantothenate/cysteine ligase [Symbiobacteriaceae bacterium]|jgi:phosphopantothenoylcysteine decarboxylase/phosphopantothenate--cysteine ligase|nr:phosphopantothenoylcysteine decarboxylase/phosphopantothenate/cysteine ligase [Symbiobacteriaceae bacterium]
MERSLQGKTVLLGVSGGIAAYKAVEITSRLVKLGAEVHVLMTPAATKLVAPLTFQAICHTPVMVDVMREQTGGVDHVHLAHKADLYVIAPATANTIANLAGGHAADWLGICGLAVTCPVLLCPAMEANMYAAPITQRNLQTLKNQGWTIMEPGEGRFASGLMGKGRLPEPADIVEAGLLLLGRAERQDLTNKKVLVTAGTTREALDPVRFIGNRSTGKMGFAIAAAAAARGADVTLVTGPSTLPDPAGVKVIKIESALEMLAACQEAFPGADITIAAAAPADYRPLEYHDQKIKKAGDEMTIQLVKNPDIIAELGTHKAPGQITVAFAAETERVIEHAREKLIKKKADFVVANDVTAAGAGFGVDTNKVSFITPGSVDELPLMTKQEVADRILDKAVLLLGER